MSQIKKAEEPCSIADRLSSHDPPRDEENSGSRQVFGDLNRIKPLLNTLKERTITFCQNTWTNSPRNAHNGILRHLDKWMGSLPVEGQGAGRSLCCHGDCKPMHSFPHLTVVKINTDENWPYLPLQQFCDIPSPQSSPLGNCSSPLLLAATTTPKKKLSSRKDNNIILKEKATEKTEMRTSVHRTASHSEHD